MKVGDLIVYSGRRKRFHGSIGVLVRPNHKLYGWIVNFPSMSHGNFFLKRSKFSPVILETDKKCP